MHAHPVYPDHTADIIIRSHGPHRNHPYALGDRVARVGGSAPVRDTRNLRKNITLKGKLWH